MMYVSGTLVPQDTALGQGFLGMVPDLAATEKQNYDQMLKASQDSDAEVAQIHAQGHQDMLNALAGGLGNLAQTVSTPTPIQATANQQVARIAVVSEQDSQARFDQALKQAASIFVREVNDRCGLPIFENVECGAIKICHKFTLVIRHIAIQQNLALVNDIGPIALCGTGAGLCSRNVRYARKQGGKKNFKQDSSCSDLWPCPRASEPPQQRSMMRIEWHVHLQCRRTFSLNDYRKSSHESFRFASAMVRIPCCFYNATADVTFLLPALLSARIIAIPCASSGMIKVALFM